MYTQQVIKSQMQNINILNDPENSSQQIVFWNTSVTKNIPFEKWVYIDDADTINLHNF